MKKTAHLKTKFFQSLMKKTAHLKSKFFQLTIDLKCWNPARIRIKTIADPKH